MRMCRDMTIFVVFEKLNFQAVIKSAASAASRIAWESQDDGFGWRATASGLSQAIGETALAADLITA